MNAPVCLSDISDIQHVMYINLEHRKDRRQHIEIELHEHMGLCCEPIWFKAIQNKNGAIGCSLSHIACLEIAKHNNWPYVMICEDDLKIVDTNLFKNSFNEILKTKIPWDVLLLAGNNSGPVRFLDRVAVQISRCLTTTGYIVKQHYYDKLINNFKEGVMHLMRNPTMSRLYAIDVYWQSLQQKDIWIINYPLTVTQRADYSDIEQKQVNYDHVMLTLNKNARHIYPFQIYKPNSKSVDMKLNY
jgi:glycosyl transferase, family 25